MTHLTRIVRGAAVALLTSGFVTGATMAQDVTHKVGSTPSGVPFTFLDVKTNQIDGVMVDIIRAIGEDQGFKPEVEATQWSALIPSLTSGKIDIIAAAMYATEERAKVVTFTDTVYTYGEGLFVKSDDAGSYKSLDDLAGKTAGVQVGTAYVEPLKVSGKFADVKVYDTIADIMRDVALGRIDVGFGDRPIVAYQLSQSASDVRLVPEYESQVTGNVAIAVRQDDADLLAKINAGLANIKASGKLDEIIAKWGIN
ncbi:ABC transporter substrate-binding protein [Phaeovulum sp. NW3]|uniref:ABC transporter substrate-binding protein n=1 Tax=Phaeovulum sp. NW3 TaxID=2934933 RepID=UPI0020225D83|nr:ABC transporter substrate-binding protein [Phaeovulum sp. NW3]MCL7464871.1 ABC transporter substrate-binding protein [Phaeovulum sp. NW3]